MAYTITPTNGNVRRNMARFQGAFFPALNTPEPQPRCGRRAASRERFPFACLARALGHGGMDLRQAAMLRKKKLRERGERQFL